MKTGNGPWRNQTRIQRLLGLPQCCEFYNRTFKCARPLSGMYHIIKGGATVDTLQDILYQYRKILSRRGHVKLYSFNQWNIGKGLWTRNQVTVLQMISTTVTMRTHGSIKLITHAINVQFQHDIQADKVRHHIRQHQTVNT